MASVYFRAENLNGKRGEKEIKKWLDKFHGTTSVSVNTESGIIAVDYNDHDITGEEIKSQLERIGYSVNPVDAE